MKPVNLLPLEQQARQTGGRPGSAHIVLGVLGAMVAAVLVYVLTLNGITSKQDEIAKLETETAAAQQRAGAYAAFQSFAQVKETRLQSVRSLAQARLDWERLMRELALVMPANAYVTSLDANTGAGAEAQSQPATGAAPTGPTMTLTGCTETHSDVATVLVRLRKLHRVAQVDLTSSERRGGEAASTGPSGGGASSTSCGSGASFTANVGFTPPTGTEVPEGKREVPAVLGGGS